MESTKKEGKKRKKQLGIEKYFSAGPSKNLKKSANEESVDNESNVLENLQENVSENSNENTAQTNDENLGRPEKSSNFGESVENESEGISRS